MQIVDEKLFCEYVAVRFGHFAALARGWEARPDSPVHLFSRPLLTEICAEATQLEELIDSYGARNNSQWFAIRERLAGVKIFSAAAHNLIHIHHSIDRYGLQGQGDFRRETRKAVLFTSGIVGDFLRETYHSIMEVDDIKSHVAHYNLDKNTFSEPILDGFLPATREVRKVATAEHAVVHLAGCFLEKAAEGYIIDSVDSKNSDEAVPDTINEESLRQLEYAFHNMQSHYDTHISDTDAEVVDERLRLLRGHISVILHLVQVAGVFVHFFERHVKFAASKDQVPQKFPVACDMLLQITFDYCLKYARFYLEEGRKISRALIARYSTRSEVKLNVPRYRGFHVRPSTLIAKIVQHYGSEVVMELLGDSYDAGKPLELFRANEKINALKRRKMAETVAKVADLRLCEVKNPMAEVRRIIMEMAQKGKLVIYVQPLTFDDKHEIDSDESLRQFVNEELARLLALGEIDMESEVEAVFRGDQRVLKDIKILAEAGYGEDRFGNNITLPSELSYLRK